MNAAAPALAMSAPVRAGHGARQTDVGTMRAWDHEWKRAEVAAWFRGPPTAPEQRSPEIATKGRDRVEAAAHASQPSFTIARPHPNVASRPSSAVKVESGAAVSVPPVPSAPMGVAQAVPAEVHAQRQTPHVADRVDLPTAAMPSADAAARTSTSSKSDVAPASRATNPIRPEPERSVHVHLERAGDGVRVWLGIPASAQGPALGANALIGELRRSLATQGYRLSSVICNGEEQP